MRSNGTSVRARVAIQRADAARRRLPDRGDCSRERQRARPPSSRSRSIKPVEGRSEPVAEVGFAEATWILIVKSIVIFFGVFAIVPVLTVVERKLIGRFQHRYGPNRVGPFGLLQPLADVVKLVGKEAFRPKTAVPLLYAIGPALVDLLRGHDAGDHALRRRQGRGRPLRHRRLDRDPLLLRLRLDRLLRPAARRLGLGLEVQLPRRDALGGAADLLRGLDGPGAARRDHDGRLAVAGRRSSRRRARSGTSSRSSSAS